MTPAAIILPDNVTVSFALSVARQHGGILQTNGRRGLIAPTLLPGYGRITGGGDRAVTIEERRPGFRTGLPTSPEAA